MIELNHRGLIVPDYNIRATLEEFATVFVWRKPTRQRIELFSKYLDYMTAMYASLGSLSFVQWIDGSFTTADANPKI